MFCDYVCAEAQIAEVRARKEAEKRRKDEDDRLYAPPPVSAPMFNPVYLPVFRTVEYVCAVRPIAAASACVDGRRQGG